MAAVGPEDRYRDLEAVEKLTEMGESGKIRFRVGLVSLGRGAP
jgi:hypothetical protein